ncbi:hypothetical protein D0T90_02270 [Neisseria animalis]|uniref:Uncharacterized protein n=1 Tax=Neisseria animalis TaxID=492 RepID=A0A5P3MPJ7_NEIAN|nr:hypothetical protein D0T90_02270 [Neisseria animalis]
MRLEFALRFVLKLKRNNGIIGVIRLEIQHYAVCKRITALGFQRLPLLRLGSAALFFILQNRKRHEL